MLDGANWDREKAKLAEAKRVARQLSRARMRGAPATLTLEEWMRTLDLFRWSCAYCGGPFEAMDHLIPDYYGGATTWQNCRPACRACNREKAKIDPRVGYMAAPRPFRGARDLVQRKPHKIRTTTRFTGRVSRRKCLEDGMPDGRLNVLIAGLRKAQGRLNQTQFAAQLGISDSMVSRVYSGSRRPALRILRKVLAALPGLEREIRDIALDIELAG